MARIRSIKPEFWESEKVGRLSPMARLTFIGLISLADDQGRGRGASEYLWGRLHSHQGSLDDPRTLARLQRHGDASSSVRSLKLWWTCVLRTIKLSGLVDFYKSDGCTYYWLPGFCEHQYIEKPSKSKFPDPPNSGNGRGSFGPGTGIKDQGKEQGEDGGVKPPPPPPASGVAATPGEVDAGAARCGPDLTLLAPVQAAADAAQGNGHPAADDDDQGPLERSDDVLRQLLQKATRTTQMPNKRQTLAKYLQAARLRHGAGEVEVWLMDPANRGADVLAMQTALDSIKRAKDRIF